MEFIAELVPGYEGPDCLAAAQVLGRNGERLGNPIGAGFLDGDSDKPRDDAGAEDPMGSTFLPFGGGSFMLQRSAAGLTYQGSLVGKVEFLGCLAYDYPDTVEFHIFDTTAPAGDLSYTIAPATQGGVPVCDGIAAPAAQTRADGLVFAEGPGSFAHFPGLALRLGGDV